MPDERTNSFITWVNSPIRGNQTTQTIVDMIQIGQWYRPEKNVRHGKMTFTLVSRAEGFYCFSGWSNSIRVY